MFKYLLIIVVLFGLLISSCKSSTTYSISGKITGDVISGVNIKLTTFQGAKIADATTDSSGNYSFSKINKGDYYVSPNLTDKQCSPPLQTISVSDSNITGIDFKITTPTTT
ncbi:MAG: hypothetical protein NTV30_09145 [Chloroflexi bacterium]|nr:hypothetical protein [Chloroflexota bacterium]